MYGVFFVVGTEFLNFIYVWNSASKVKYNILVEFELISLYSF
jgi:hypothetical protein